jgi:hypothetical protein
MGSEHPDHSEPAFRSCLVARFHRIEGCSAQKDKKADKKIGKIRKMEGAAAGGVEGFGAARVPRIDQRLGSILILPDLLIFLFHPLRLDRPAYSYQQQSALGRSTRTRGCSSRTEGANKIRARLIHPSHWLRPMHRWCGPQGATDRSRSASGRWTRATGSSRPTSGAIRPSHRLMSINLNCDPPEPPAQVDRPMVRSIQAVGSGGRAIE